MRIHLGLIFACSVTFIGQINAYCSRCSKIETDRAKEQIENPQPWRYYDDVPNLNKKEEQIKKTDASTNVLEVKKDDKHPLLAANEQTVNNKFFFEEDAIFKDDVPQQHQDSSSTVNPKNLLSTQSSSILYDIFKIKNFLETFGGPFTLFLPTDEALRQLIHITQLNFIHPENKEKLAVLISNHLVPAKLLNKDFRDYNHLEIKAISGKNLTLSSKNENLFIDDVQILRSEAAGNNGIIYVIDKVLHP